MNEGLIPSPIIPHKEGKTMETPETNVKWAALNLLRFKAMSQMCEGKSTCTLDESDVNEILLVGGMPLIVPESFKSKELEVM